MPKMVDGTCWYTAVSNWVTWWDSKKFNFYMHKKDINWKGNVLMKKIDALIIGMYETILVAEFSLKKKWKNILKNFKK